MGKLILTIFFLSICLTGAWADTIYTWKDKDGVVHMTNTPPPTNLYKKQEITQPEETPEERAFRARQKAAMDRMESDFKKKEAQKIRKKELTTPPGPSKEKLEDERRASIRRKIEDLEVSEKRYHAYEKDSYYESDRQYWYEKRKAKEKEIDDLKRELTE